MKKTRTEAWSEYRRTGRNKSNYDLNDRDLVKSILRDVKYK